MVRSLSLFPSLLISERQAFCTEGAAKLFKRVWPYAMEPLDLGRADLA